MFKTSADKQLHDNRRHVEGNRDDFYHHHDKYYYSSPYYYDCEASTEYHRSPETTVDALYGSQRRISYKDCDMVTPSPSASQDTTIYRTVTFDHPGYHVGHIYDDRPIPSMKTTATPRRMPACTAIDKDPNPEDVLFGRGGGTNRHPGNIYFRVLVTQNQSNYLISKKLEKAAIARHIVRTIRHRGGQFLKFNEEAGMWFDVGDKKAALKTSQALREGTAQKMRETLLAMRSQNTKSNSWSSQLDAEDENHSIIFNTVTDENSMSPV